MRDFSRTIDIRATPDAVWRVMCDVERWPEWNPTIKRLRLLGDDSFGVGARAVIRQPRFPPALWKVTEVDEGRGFEWVSKAPGLQVVADHRIEATGPGSRVTVSLRLNGAFGAVWGRLTGGVSDRYLQLEAEGLKRRVEGR